MNHVVKPLGAVVDYNTRFSGLRAEDMTGAKSLLEVQMMLLSRIDARTVLIGHSLDGDLVALKVRSCEYSHSQTYLSAECHTSGFSRAAVTSKAYFPQN